MKRFFVFSLVIILTFTVSLAFYTCFAVGDNYDGDGTRTFYWYDKNINFNNPDMYYVVSDPYQVVRPNLDSIGDVDSFAFRYQTDSLGTEEGVSLSLTYTGGFQGGLNYVYHFSFDIFHLLGSAGMIYPYNYQFKISAFCDYAAQASIIEGTGNNIQIRSNEQVHIDYVPDGNGEAAIFTCIYMPEAGYRVNVQVAATAPVDFNMCGILIEYWRTWSYDPTIDGVFETTDPAGEEELKLKEESLYNSVIDDVNYTKTLINPIYFNSSFVSSCLRACKVCFNRLFENFSSFKLILNFSVGLGLLSFVLMIGSGIVSYFKHRGD